MTKIDPDLMVAPDDLTVLEPRRAPLDMPRQVLERGVRPSLLDWIGHVFFMRKA
ncbi:hypothetical protein ACOI1H_12720 [Loktanella sp. DJP18]|uniref:hypothetical protein n=1 Tax=Loktanella sp. DJP18 TaxID=3409788 RepID=UPI003BB6EA79